MSSHLQRFRIETLEGKPLREYGFEDFSTDFGLHLQSTMSALAEYFVGVLNRDAYPREVVAKGVDVHFVCIINGEKRDAHFSVSSGPRVSPHLIKNDVLKGDSNCTQNWFNLPNLLKPKVIFYPDYSDEDKSFVIRQRSLPRWGPDETIRVPFGGATSYETGTRKLVELAARLNFMASKVTPTPQDVEREVKSFFIELVHASLHAQPAPTMDEGPEP